MSASFLELLDAGVCTGGCLLSVPKTYCDCRCGGWLHGLLVGWLQQHEQGTFQFAGFQDINVITHRGRYLAQDPQHSAGGLWGRTA